MKILIVEDDPTVVQTLQILLASCSYAVDVANDGEAGLQMVEVYDYDLIMLDMLLPNLGGLDVCQQLRKQGCKTPILLLTGQDGGRQKAIALNAGADDYVVKPFDAEELIARVQALLRRGNTATQPILAWGPLSVDPGYRRVAYGTRLLSVTPKEYAILELFLRNPQKPLNASMILDRVWTALESPGDEAVRVHIKDLRQKLAAAGAPKDFIKTKHRVGYQLNPLYATVPEVVPGEALTVPQIAELNAVNEELRATLEARQSVQAELQQQHQALELAYQTVTQECGQLQADRDELERRVAERTAELQQLYDEAPCGYLSLDATGVVLQINATGLKMVGYTAAEMVGKPCTEFMTPESAAVFQPSLAQCFQRGFAQDREFQIVCKDGSILPVSISARVVRNSARGDVLVRAVVIDIRDRVRLEAERQQLEAERQKAEFSLRDSEERYRLLFESNPNPMWFFDPQTLRLIEVNTAAIAHYGYSRAEFLQMTLTEICAVPDCCDLPLIASQLEAGQPYVGITRHCKKDGTAIDVEISAYAFVVAGQPTNLALIKDISDRVQAEAARQASEAKYCTLFNSIDEGFVLCDVVFNERNEPEDMVYVEANAMAVRMTGQELAGRRASELCTQFEPEWLEVFGQVAQTGEAVRMELPVTNRNTWYEFYAFRPEVAHPTRIAIIYKDIGQRIQLEQDLIKNRNLLERIFHESSDALFLIEAETLLTVDCNQRAIDLFEVAGKTDLLHITRHILQQQPTRPGEDRLKLPESWNQEIEYVTQQGRRFWGDLSVKAITFGAQQFHLMRIIDISDRKRFEAEREQAELHLRQREEFLSSIYNGAEQAIFVVAVNPDQSFHYLSFNRVAEHYAGVTAQSVIGKTPEAVFGPVIGARFHQHALRCLQAGTSITYEEHLAFPHITLWTLTTLSPLHNAEGRIYRLIGTSIDISDRKQAEIMLKLSQAKFEALVRNMPGMVYRYHPAQPDQPHHFTFVSPQATDLLELSPDTLLASADALIELIHPDDVSSFQTSVLDAVESFSTWHWEGRVITPSGQLKWIHGTSQPQQTTEGEAWDGLLLDISDRKQAQQTIQEQASLLDIVSDAIYVRDLDNHILYWNQGAERLYGWPAAVAIGQKVDTLLQSPDAQIETVLQRLSSRGEWQGEVHNRTQTGQTVVVVARWTLVQDEAEQPQCILTVDTDITEQKQLEAQFYRAQRLESLGVLASGIAHDLNNVLTPILAVSQLLQTLQPKQDRRSQEMLKVLETSAKRGANLVKQILTFSRGNGGERRPLSVVPITQELTKVIRQTFPKTIELYSILPDEEPGLVSADATHLHQVLMNLCINARDAMPNGGTLTISVEPWVVDQAIDNAILEPQVGAYVVITVADTGMGIPLEIRDRIFDPFFTTKPPGQGTGLGLATVLGIIKDYGGFLQVMSGVGVGTQIRVCLPMLVTETHQVQSVMMPMVGNGERIFVVDDDESVRCATRSLLENHHYNVLLAKDGQEAIELYRQHHSTIAVVLLDITMPNMDGITLIHHLKAMNSTVQIIAMSGLVANKKPALAAGATVFITKPYSADILLDTVWKLSSTPSLLK